jgi:hypothetical protein
VWFGEPKKGSKAFPRHLGKGDWGMEVDTWNRVPKLAVLKPDAATVKATTANPFVVRQLDDEAAEPTMSPQRRAVVDAALSSPPRALYPSSPPPKKASRPPSAVVTPSRTIKMGMPLLADFPRPVEPITKVVVYPIKSRRRSACTCVSRVRRWCVCGAGCCDQSRVGRHSIQFALSVRLSSVIV